MRLSTPQLTRDGGRPPLGTPPAFLPPRPTRLLNVVLQTLRRAIALSVLILGFELKKEIQFERCRRLMSESVDARIQRSVN